MVIDQRVLQIRSLGREGRRALSVLMLIRILGFKDLNISKQIEQIDDHPFCICATQDGDFSVQTVSGKNYLCNGDSHTQPSLVT